ncbi:MAG: primosomal protein N' [Bacteroidales bacterium]|nr:primosomal protein N' [Bacteroidales bacterium]
MAKSGLYVDVLLPLALPGAFTYHVDSGHAGRVEPGKRVIVQFGRRKYYSAIIYRVHYDEPKEYKTKPVQTVLDDQPVINSFQMRLWEWMAQYYMCTLGEVYKASLPSGLKLESETKVVYQPAFDEHAASLTEKEALILDVLKDENVLGLKELADKTGRKDVLPIVNSLMNKQALTVEEKLKDAYKPRKESFVKLNFGPEDEQMLNQTFKQLKNAPKQVEILMYLIKLLRNQGNDSDGFVPRQKLLKETSGGTSPLKGLIDKGVVIQEDREISRIGEGNHKQGGIKDLTSAQQEAYDQIQRGFEEKEVALLHGITSSGKTEIYIHLIREQLKKGNQVLYLLPEIALTSQIIHRLKAVFGEQVGVYHSKFPDNERVEVYQKLLNQHETDKFRVILGVRSSIFLPFSKLGLVIVDEEHENTYKQFDPAPRYHARDAAIMLARMHGAKTLLGTATPSIESYYNAKRGKYGLVELMTRYLDIQLPQILIGDILEAKKKKEMSSHFTPTLIENMDEALKNNEQIILFQNRRGFSPYMQCEQCGWIPECKHCDVSLTYHRRSNNLICHYCGYSVSVPQTCPACESQQIATRGFGTEKVEDEIPLFLPDARVKRMDLDSTRSRNAYENIIASFENHEIDILVGTQMVSKGLDFDNVSVVGILNADNMLNFPDFRAFERSYHLMAQVSGRAGRKKKQGRVIIQTSQPNHSIIKNVLENDFYGMYQSQLRERKEFMYPPYYRLVKILLKHRNREVLNDASELLKKELQKMFGYRVLGPQDPLIGRVQNYHLKHVIIKIEKEKSPSKSKELIRKITTKVQSSEKFKSLQVHYDVDPL